MTKDKPETRTIKVNLTEETQIIKRPFLKGVDDTTPERNLMNEVKKADTKLYEFEASGFQLINRIKALAAKLEDKSLSSEERQLVKQELEDALDDAEEVGEEATKLKAMLKKNLDQ